jgi:NAD-dependent dihydropyrimidine dehydrogenase PreA subunit
MTTLTMWVLIALGVLSLLYKNFWCRYLCPYGALAGLLSRLSPLKIKRNEEKCTHCHACTTHCPTQIDVEAQALVKSEECFGCLTCVSRCRAEGALEIRVKAGKKETVVKPWIVPVALIILFYLVIGIGVLTGNWHSKVPYEDYQSLIPEVQKEYAGRR